MGRKRERGKRKKLVATGRPEMLRKTEGENRTNGSISRIQDFLLK